MSAIWVIAVFEEFFFLTEKHWKNYFPLNVICGYAFDFLWCVSCADLGQSIPFNFKYLIHILLCEGRFLFQYFARFNIFILIFRHVPCLRTCIGRMSGFHWIKFKTSRNNYLLVVPKHLLFILLVFERPFCTCSCASHIMCSCFWSKKFWRINIIVEKDGFQVILKKLHLIWLFSKTKSYFIAPRCIWFCA